MKIFATRDSVAAGDDVDAPHERQFSFPDLTSVQQAIDLIVNSGYLAGVQGRATWSVVSNIPISVVAQEWSHSRSVHWQSQGLTAQEIQSGLIKLHFNYHAQIDPEIVLEVLKRLKLKVPDNSASS
jgi:hypothetical protein